MKKQEAKKLNKKWLVLGICLAVLLVAVGVVIAVFGGVFQNEQPTDPAGDVVLDGKLYWNVERDNYKDGLSSHQKVGDSVYRMLFSVDGEQVKLDVQDIELVRYIDTLEVMGLVFDQNGIVVDAMNVEECTGGYAAKNYYVESVDGNTIVANNNYVFRGYSKTLEITENTKIYNVGETGPLCGLPGTVQYNDEIIAVEDHDGNITHIYTIPYKAPGDFYWNVDKPYDSTLKMSTREVTDLGYYELKFIINGQEVTYRCKDKEVVDQIDASRVLGLEFDEDGYIIGKIDIKVATNGGRLGATNYYIEDLNYQDGKIAFRNKAVSDDSATIASFFPMDDIVVYDMTGNGAYKGQVTDLRVNDRIICILDSRGMVHSVYLVGRAVDSPLYWNVDRDWNKETLTTNRTPDANGWYYFKMAVNGEQITVRTNDLAIANAIEQPVNVGLKLNGDIVEKVYTAASVYPGGTFASWYFIAEIGADGTITAERTTNGVTNTYVAKLAEDCDIFNTSTTATMEGERITVADLKVGDTIHGYKNYDGELEILYLVSSVSDSPMYWNVDKNEYWDSKNKTSKRVPDENGYYSILFAVNGKQVTLRTRDKKMVDDIDNRTCMGLNVNGSLITKVFGAVQTVNTKGGLFASSYYVTAIDGNKITATAMSGTKKGEVVSANMAWNVQIYDVSKTAALVGQKSSVKVGDQIRGLLNADKQIAVLYILTTGNHAENHACDCCGENVLWLPYDGAATMVDGGHYVLSGDAKVTKSISIKEDMTVTLCLNGHTLTRESARVLGDIKGTLNIVDCVGTGAVHGMVDNNASVAMVSGGTLNIYGGKLTANEVIEKNKNGGVLAIIGGGQINMYGGEISGGKATGYGGNINISDGTFTLNGGTITGGTSADGKYGGNIALSGKNAKLIVNGGEISGGFSGSYGGNIGVADGGAIVEINGGVIKDGTATTHGGNITMAVGTLTVTGGQITGGKAGTTGGSNLSLANATKATFTGGTISGGTIRNTCTGGVALGGSVNIYQLTLSGNKFTVDTDSLTKDAKIVLDVARYLVIAENVKKDVSKQFGCVNPAYTVEYVDGSLVVDVATKHTHCDCGGAGDHTCDDTILWKPLDASTALEDGGHYYLTGNLKRQLVLPDNAQVSICLNGYTLSHTSRVIDKLTAGKTLNIHDCSALGTGSVSSTMAASNAPVAQVNGGVLNLYGGSYTAVARAEANKNGGVIVVMGSGELNLYDGLIYGGDATGHGGNIHVAQQGVFNMYGGHVYGGSSDLNGGNISVTGTETQFNLYGGLVDDGTATRNGNSVYAESTVTLGGNGQIDDLYLSSTGEIAIGENFSAENGSVTLTMAAPGVFAENVAEDVSAAFESKDTVCSVKYDEAAKTLLLFMPHAHCWCIGAQNAPAHDCVDTQQWTAVNSDAPNPMVLEDGKFYYLNWSESADGVAKGLKVANDATAYLCLNGSSIRAQNVITLGTNSKLVICDCSEDASGLITTSKNAPVKIADGNEVALMSGTISGTLVYKGAITNQITSVTMTGGTFKMYGGAVKDGVSTGDGGNISMTGGALYVYGGEITGGAAGGNGKDVYVGGGSFTVGGKVTIGDVYLADGMTIALDSSFDASASTIGVSMETIGAPIVAVTEDLSATFPSSSSAYITTFDTDKLILTEKPHTHCWCENADVKPVDHVCVENQVWTELKADTVLEAGGHYFLGSERTTSIDLPEGEVFLCLNGQSLSSTSRVLVVGAGKTVHVCDCGETGEVSGKLNSSAPTAQVGGGILNIWSGTFTANAIQNNNGGVMNVTNHGQINMYGGKITGGQINGTGTNTRGGNVNVGANGTMTMYGGEISNGHSGSSQYGGNVAITNATGRFVMKGGAVYGGEAGTHGGNIGGIGQFVMEDGQIYDGTANAYGGNVSLAATGSAVITGGSITGGEATSYAPCVSMKGSGDLTIGGNAVIDDVYLGSGKTVTVSADKPLTGSKTIGITVEEAPAAGATVTVATGAANADAFRSSMTGFKVDFVDGEVVLAVDESISANT